MEAPEFLRRVQARPPLRSELPFPMAEYEERLARIRRAMDAAGLDALLLCDPANMYYVSGYYTFETSVHAALLVPRDGGVALQLHAIEVSNPALKSWVSEIVPYNRGEGPYQIRDQLMALLAACGLAAKRIGIEAGSPGLRIRYLRELEAALPNAAFPDATDLMLRLRAVKSPREIDCHRQAAAITSLGMKAGLAAIAPGRTENEVAGTIYSAMAAAGSEFMSVQPIVAAGYRNSFNHAHFYRKAIEPGELVLLEHGACYRRHTSPLIRNAFVGEPPDQVRRFDAAVTDCLGRVLAHARAGRTSHEVAVEATKAILGIRDEAYHYGTYAYSVGVQFPPSWVEGWVFIAEGNETVLEAGMIFHTPIAFRTPHGINLARSETFLIRATDCEVLTDCPRDLHRVPGWHWQPGTN